MRRSAIALVLLALSGCGGDGDGDAAEPAPTARACTEIGCVDSVDVQLKRVPRGARVRLCVDGSCQPAKRAGSPRLYSVNAPLERGSGDRVRVTVTVRTAGRTIARVAARFTVRTARPNGPGCPPVCRFVNASFDVPSRTLQEV
jgi:hypothetical protein